MICGFLRCSAKTFVFLRKSAAFSRRLRGARGQSTLAADLMEKLERALMHPRRVSTVDERSEPWTTREGASRGGVVEACFCQGCGFLRFPVPSKCWNFREKGESAKTCGFLQKPAFWVLSVTLAPSPQARPETGPKLHHKQYSRIMSPFFLKGRDKKGRISKFSSGPLHSYDGEGSSCCMETRVRRTEKFEVKLRPLCATEPSQNLCH